MLVKIQFKKADDETLAEVAEKLNGHNDLILNEIQDNGDGTFWATITFENKYDMRLTIAQLYGLVALDETDTDKIAAGVAMASEYYTEED